MHLIFCSDPLKPTRPDPVYAAEVAAADSLAIPYSLISFEALVYDGDAAKSVRRVLPHDDPVTAVYRGWMLRPEQYRLLYMALGARNVRLINDPEAYKYCHYLPEWYGTLAGLTPRSVWLPLADFSLDHVMELLRPLGAGPVIVKDYVKSRKHEWDEACYIPSAADRAAVARVVQRFLELQGADLNEGLVFREFVQFAALGTHSQSGMPLTEEYRLIFLDGELLAALPYWDEAVYGASEIPLQRFKDAARRVRSRFFTMDVARRTDGSWLIVELGDGQVAGLPGNADPMFFYANLSAGLL